MSIYIYTGWCFGTMEFYVSNSYVGNVIIPTDEIIFFRGVETTNQYMYIVYLLLLRGSMILLWFDLQ